MLKHTFTLFKTLGITIISYIKSDIKKRPFYKGHK